MFKSKHKLDLSLVSMDQRGKQLLGYSDSEMSSKGGYDLVHYDDLAYLASAHQERKSIYLFDNVCLLIYDLNSFENWSIRIDCLPFDFKRSQMAMAANECQISL